MLNRLFRYSYVEDEFALYVPDTSHIWFEDLHNVEVGVFTQRSLLPVSRWRRRSWGGVPSEALKK